MCPAVGLTSTRDLGDHPERALGAEEQLSQVWAGGRFRRAAEHQGPARCRDLELDHALVEAAVAGRCLAARSRRGEAADRRVLERLREVAERVPALVEQPLGVGALEAWLQGRYAGGLVESVSALSLARSSASRPRTVGVGFEAADDRCAAAVWHDRDPVLAARGEQSLDLVVAARPRNGVGRSVEVAAPQPQEVGRGLAARVADPRLRAPIDLGDRVEQPSGSRDGTSEIVSIAGTGVPSCVTPSPSLSSSTIVGGNGVASAGSPHPDQSISAIWRQ